MFFVFLFARTKLDDVRNTSSSIMVIDGNSGIAHVPFIITCLALVWV